MSYIGAIPQSTRQVLATWAAKVDSPAVIAGVGNFTIPSVLRSAGHAHEIHACDISLYSSALGAYLAGTPIDIRENPECPEHLQGFLDTTTPARMVASIALIFDMRDFWQLKNPYQVRMFEQ